MHQNGTQSASYAIHMNKAKKTRCYAERNQVVTKQPKAREKFYLRQINQWEMTQTLTFGLFLLELPASLSGETSYTLEYRLFTLLDFLVGAINNFLYQET